MALMSQINFCKLRVGNELRFDVWRESQFLGSIRCDTVTEKWSYYPSDCDGGNPLFVTEDISSLKAEICAAELDGCLGSAKAADLHQTKPKTLDAKRPYSLDALLRKEAIPAWCLGGGHSAEVQP